MKPEFIDNREGNTLAAALRGHLRWAREAYRKPLALAVATGYFNPEGFWLLADDLDGLRSIRLLLGAEPHYPPVREVQLPGEPRGEELRTRRLQESLRAAENGIRRDRDLLDFSREVDGSIRRLLEFVESKKLEVRRFEQGFLHGKAYIFSDADGVVAGSSNFTAAGLTSNLELNLGHYAPSIVEKVQDWFEDLWEAATPYDLAALYQERIAEYNPYLVFLRVLWERYGQELEGERDAAGRIPLTTFQSDGVSRAARILADYHGVVVADGVGLGKTFIAGELIRRVREERKRVLLVAPATLRDGTWRTFLHEHDLNVEVVSFEQLMNERQLGGERAHLRSDIQDYSLIAIDEAHAFRNPDTDRATTLRTLLQGSPPKDLLLLTATPVNNSLWDLYYLLAYFVGHDAVFADRGIPSLRKRFQQAASIDPEDLRPDLLFDVLDLVTVRRTRHFVRRYYPDDRIRGPGGEELVVRFPEPEVRAVTYRLDEVLPGFFADFARALMPDSGEPLLGMARFRPSLYRLGSTDGEERSEAALAGLVRSALLKRFESSVHAFSRTLERMVAAHDGFLDALDRGYVPTAVALEAVEEVTDTATEEAIADLLREHGAEPARNFDVARLRADVQADRDLLDSFRARASTVGRDRDPKLAALVQALVQIARRADRDAASEDERRDNGKVLVFSYFAETVDWIVEHLREAAREVPELARYRGRIASVSGQESRGGIGREEAVFGFAPRSMEAPPGSDGDRYDVLVATDVLAEGLNLQQCRNIVNFDLPWNPMRLVQRHGRIDRIGSRHSRVFLRCFFPDERLDQLLDLETRIRHKLAQAAASIGVESQVIPGGPTGEVVFSETREEIEKLRREDAEVFVLAGEDPRAHSGEEYRQELRKGIEHYGEARIRDLSWSAGSGFAGGEEEGYMFCARVGERSFLRFVRGEKPIVRDTLEILRRIACTMETPRALSREMADGAYAAWQTARRDIFEEWTFATDPANLQPKIRPVFRRAADHLRRHAPPGTEQEQVERAIAALEAPRGLRVEREVRAVLGAKPEDVHGTSAALLKAVRELGLRPFEPPQPLPVIQEDDIVLVCWMAIDERA